MSFLSEKRIVVAGGAGFLGQHVVRKLQDFGCRNVFVPRKAAYDLCEIGDVLRLFATAKPDVFIHLAGLVGGIGFTRTHPGRSFYENAIMGIQVIEQARRAGVEKLVYFGTVCGYPKFAPTPFREDDVWSGYPEETNAPYGLAKKMPLVQCQAYREQYGFNGVYLLPVNLYGPGDDFDLKYSHVIPAMIRKFLEAKERNEKEVVCWGTGSASREFLYVEDAAEGVVLATERYNKSDPVNLGSGKEITIRDLANLIRDLIGFTGEIRWDPSYPDGQPRRLLDVSRAEREFGFRARTSFADGLRKTIDWYVGTQAASTSL